MIKLLKAWWNKNNESYWKPFNYGTPDSLAWKKNVPPDLSVGGYIKICQVEEVTNYLTNETRKDVSQLWKVTKIKGEDVIISRLGAELKLYWLKMKNNVHKVEYTFLGDPSVFEFYYHGDK